MSFRNILTMILFSIIVLLSISSAKAITASLGNPRMVLYTNITANTPGILEKKYIQINNVNDYPVEVAVSSDEVLKNLSIILKEEDLNFTLQPNASREVYFTLFAVKPNFYEGKLFITFKGALSPDAKPEQVGLAANIAVNAKGEEFTGDLLKFMKKYGYEEKTGTGGITGTSTGASPVIGIVLVIAIVGLGMLTYYLFKKK